MNRLKLLFALALTLTPGIALAQQYTISTVAGIPGVQGYFGDGSAATSGQLSRPFRVSADSKNNIYICDIYTHTVRMVKASDGTISTLAGTGAGGFSGDGGSANQAILSDPHGVAADANGNIYIADTSNSRIRKIDSKGVISTFAGSGARGYSGDGSDATKANLWFPGALAVDGSGNLFVADYGNSTIRKITSAGAISTVAGTGTWGFSGDGGAAAKALLANPVAVALDGAGNIYVGDTGNNTIRRIGGDGNIRTLLSNVNPESLAVDSAGSVYFVEPATPVVRKLLPTGTLLKIAGNGVPGYNGDAIPALSAQLNFPTGVAVGAAGKVYVADSNNQVIRLLTPDSFSVGAVTNAASGNQSAISPGEIVTLYGTGIGPATLAQSTGQPFGTQLGGVTVTFNSIPSPLIYVSANQVAAVAPYALQNFQSADIAVSYQGNTTVNTTVPVVAAAPGVFTADATGSGQAAALNQNGSLNNAANPARIGSIVTLYLTGEGQTTPAGVDAKIATGPTYPQPVLPVRVQIGGVPAVVSYAGAAPTLIAGVMQVNVQIPAGVPTGASVPVSVQVGTAATPTGVTIAIIQ